MLIKKNNVFKKDLHFVFHNLWHVQIFIKLLLDKLHKTKYDSCSEGNQNLSK